ncbi:MAG: hypothetical protein SVR04_17015 [Spirochaetota bacterium]|nr:hypothetical protein [Spirochaetota bacterium]
MNSNSTEKRDIRKFGIIAFVFFGCLCGLGLWTGKAIPVYLFGSLSIIGLGFMVMPGPLRLVYEGWLKVTHFIGKIITFIVLTLAYYLMMTPSAALKRVFGGRPLPMKPDKNAGTYWVTREEKVQPRERFLKRY